MKSKFSAETILLTRANKILKHFYHNILSGRDLSREELIAEAKNVIRKWDDAQFLVNMSFVSSLEKNEWEKIAELK